MFPFIDGDTVISDQSDTVTAKEFAWDFVNNDFLLRNGKPYIVEGIEAVEIWIYKTLKTPRYKYNAYTWNYGVEFEDLIGKKLSREYIGSELMRMIRDALLINQNITAIKDLEWTLAGRKLSIDMTVETVFGEVNVNV